MLRDVSLIEQHMAALPKKKKEKMTQTLRPPTDLRSSKLSECKQLRSSMVFHLIFSTFMPLSFCTNTWNFCLTRKKNCTRKQKRNCPMRPLSLTQALDFKFDPFSLTLSYMTFQGKKSAPLQRHQDLLSYAGCQINPISMNFDLQTSLNI